MVLKRFTTGILIAIIAGLATWFGEPWFTQIAYIAAAAAIFEFYRVVKSEHVQPLTYLGTAFAIMLILDAHSPYEFTLPLILVLATLIPLIWMLFRQNKHNSFINWGWTIAGVLYIGWLLSFYISIRALNLGAYWVLLILACTAFCDVFAFIVGSTMGKHHLATSVSPGKTWEGTGGGMAASIICAVALSTLFKLPLLWWQAIIAGIIISFFSQMGDLVESLLKRNMQVKDAGHILPGHGGILDRIDSHLLIAPVAYYLLLLAKSQGWFPS